VTGVAPAETHYQVLGLEPRATGEQIEKSYLFHLGLYGEEALATYSLLDADELREARARVQEAFETLRDPVRRYEYDVANGFVSAGALVVPFPTPAAPNPARPPAASVARPAALGVPPEAARVRHAPQVLPDPVDGAALRRFREERGVSLRDISLVTKVGVRYLEYIEADRHALLPAPVYLRGFLQEYARVVGLEPRRTAESYLAGVPRDS